MTKAIVLVTLFALITIPPVQAPQLRSTLVTTVRGEVNGWAPTRDGKRIYFVRDSTQLVMFDRATGKETTLGELRTEWLDVSPAGDRLAFSRRNEDGRGFNMWTTGLNPATGVTIGTPARVSLMSVDEASVFSPDGKMLTLAKDQQSIAIVPANGGPERVLMRSKGYFWPVRWAPDGKSLYAGVSFDNETATERNGIYRIPVDGGSPQLIVRTADWGAYPGLTPDGKFLVYWKPAWDSVVVQTIGGARVAAFVPPEGTDVPDKWFDTNRGYSSDRRRPRAMNLRLSNPERTVALPDTIGNPPFAVRWSPDGKRVAAIGRSPRQLVVMNADGSVQRRFKVSEGVNANFGMKWSPDGQRLVYSVPGAGIHVVDVTTGAESHFSAGFSPQRTNPIWRSDSRAILYGIADTARGADSLVQISLRERELGGAERVLRTVRAQSAAAMKVINDSVAVAWRLNEYRAIPLRHSGDSRIVYTREGGGQPVPTFSENGLWMAVRVAVQGERLPRRVDVMRIDGSERRTVQLDLTTLSGPENPIVSDDGRELIVLGAVSDGFEYRRVDVASGRSTTLATIRTAERGGIGPSGLSPDGRAVLYYPALRPYALIYEVDMSNILKAAGPAGGRGTSRQIP